jgi:hypothetical protein
MIDESVHCFGPGEILTGIYAATPDGRANETCVVFLNSGLLHRVGPYRMFVDFAREIAYSGFPVMRFDLSGLGESMVRPEASAERVRVVADIRETLDFLQVNFGHRHFVLIGLCSGADNAHWAALEDSRIAGAVMMDGPGYVDLQYHIAHYLPRLFSLARWRSVLSKLVRKALPTSGKGAAPRQELFVRPFPPKEQMEKEIQQLAGRGTKLLYIYTGGVEYYYNRESQFRQNFPAVKFNRPDSPIEYEYHREFEHTYPDLRHRRYLFARVLDWLSVRFSGAGTSRSAGTSLAVPAGPMS